MNKAFFYYTLLILPGIIYNNDLYITSPLNVTISKTVQKKSSYCILAALAYSAYSWCFRSNKQKDQRTWSRKEWNAFFKKELKQETPAQARKTILEYWPGYLSDGFCLLIASYPETPSYLTMLRQLNNSLAFDDAKASLIIAESLDLPGFTHYFSTLSHEEQLLFKYSIAKLEVLVLKQQQKEEKRSKKKNRQNKTSTKADSIIDHTRQQSATLLEKQNTVLKNSPPLTIERSEETQRSEHYRNNVDYAHNSFERFLEKFGPIRGHILHSLITYPTETIIDGTALILELLLLKKCYLFLEKISSHALNTGLAYLAKMDLFLEEEPIDKQETHTQKS